MTACGVSNLRYYNAWVQVVNGEEPEKNNDGS